MTTYVEKGGKPQVIPADGERHRIRVDGQVRFPLPSRGRIRLEAQISGPVKSLPDGFLIQWMRVENGDVDPTGGNDVWFPQHGPITGWDTWRCISTHVISARPSLTHVMATIKVLGDTPLTVDLRVIKVDRL